MSRKKIYTTVGIAEEVMRRLKEECERDDRGKGFFVEKGLRLLFGMNGGAIKSEDVQHANKS